MTDVASPLPRTWSSQAGALAGLFATGMAMLLVTGFALRFYQYADWNLFIAVLMLSGLLTVVATQISLRAPATIGLAVVLGFGLALRLFVMSEDPLLSTDIYRYIWNGRVQAAGINPYLHVPNDAALASLRDAAIFPNINRVDYAPTIYPPVAQFFFAAITRIGESVTVVRLGLIGCEAVTIAVLIDLLRRFNKPVTLAAAYAWHPLPVWEIANSGHVDALMVALVMVGVWFLVRHRKIAAGIMIALGALVKPYALVALPACWRPWDWRVPLAVILAVAACYVPYLGAGGRVFGFLSGYLGEEGLSSGSGFWLVHATRTLVGDVPGLLPAYLALAAATLAGLALRTAFRSEDSPEQRTRDIAVLLMAALFFVSPNYPWYFLVIVPFIPLGGGAPAWVLSLGAFMLYILLPDYDARFLIWKGVLSGAFLVAVIATVIARGPSSIRLQRVLPWNH
ncbi:MAG: alpha,6-mannosyltransferase [Alphaproteobacteria bacterium]|nr:alpha,6-mannosyltransferase [Alphaproteobacteria bacterium]